MMVSLILKYVGLVFKMLIGGRTCVYICEYNVSTYVYTCFFLKKNSNRLALVN